VHEAGLFGNSYVIRDTLSKKCSIFRTVVFGWFACVVGKTERLFSDHVNVGNDSGVIAWLNATNGFKTCQPNS
jgi:hypothetical protein